MVVIKTKHAITGLKLFLYDKRETLGKGKKFYITKRLLYEYSNRYAHGVLNPIITKMSMKLFNRNSIRVFFLGDKRFLSFEEHLKKNKTPYDNVTIGSIKYNG